MKELKKSIVILENDRHKLLKSLHELDKTIGRDERLTRIEKLAELESIESELADKNLLLASSEIVPAKRTHLRVAIGSVVDLIDKHGHLFRYTVVNSVEANPSDGRISTKSPIGQSLLGRTVRDIIEWGSGNNVNRLQLIQIL
jgi:transcription elongation GreA/GreB family factor